MEPEVRSVRAELYMDDLLQTLEVTGQVPLVISGSSMDPFLVHGRDTVFLTKWQQPAKRGQMLLYRRAGGQYVLHRVYKAGEQELQLIGDGQLTVEPGIRPEQVLATVSAVRRKGKLVKPGHPIWVFYEKIWIRLIRGRGRLLRLYRRLRPGTASMEHKT